MNLRGKVTFTLQNLNAGTLYNVLCGLAPTNQPVGIEGFGWYGNANSAQTPGLLSFCRAATQGSGGTTITPQPTKDRYSETFQSSWISLPSTAPTSVVIIDERQVNPQVGLAEYFPGAIAYEMKGGGIFVVQFTPQFSGNYSGWLLIAE